MTILKNLLLLAATIIIWTIVWNKINPTPTTLEEFCKGNPEVLLTLEGKGLSDGTLYMKCDGKLYQSSIEVITHQYDKGNNHVRIYGNSGEPVEDFEIDTINGGI